MMPKPETLYRDMMKKALSFTLWPEPPVPLENFNYSRPAFKRRLVSFISRLLARKNIQLVEQRPICEGQRAEGRIWPGYADTMVGVKRLNNLQFCIERVIKEEIEGDLIETGVWRGGSSIFMRAVLAAYRIEDRKVFVADSFEGLPEPDTDKWPADRGDTHFEHNEYLGVSQSIVENNFKRYGLLDDQVVFLKGYFEDTLPTAPIEKLAILRLDGDMYGSTMDALDSLYSKLSKGGYCIVDDYALATCKAAVDDYRAKHNIDAELIKIDWTGVYWRKE
jgi:O-methyltransferase